MNIYVKNSTQPITVNAVYWNDNSFKNFISKRPTNRWTSPFNILLDNNIPRTMLSVAQNDPIYVNKIVIPKRDCPQGKLSLAFKHLFSNIKFTINFKDPLLYRSHMLDVVCPISNFKVDGLISGTYLGTYPSWIIGDPSVNIPQNYPSNIISFEYPQIWHSLEGLSDYVLMAIPQSVPNNTLKVSFDLDGKNYIWTCAVDNLSFEGNKEYDINLNIISTSTKSDNHENSLKVVGTLQKAK